MRNSWESRLGHWEEFFGSFKRILIRSSTESRPGHQRGIPLKLVMHSNKEFLSFWPWQAETESFKVLYEFLPCKEGVHEILMNSCLEWTPNKEFMRFLPCTKRNSLKDFTRFWPWPSNRNSFKAYNAFYYEILEILALATVKSSFELWNDF